jgi:hypothetical protein
MLPSLLAYLPQTQELSSTGAITWQLNLESLSVLPPSGHSLFATVHSLVSRAQFIFLTLLTVPAGRLCNNDLYKREGCETDNKTGNIILRVFFWFHSLVPEWHRGKYIIFSTL